MEESEEDRYTRITLRIPRDLHRSLTDAADMTSKSLNAEIVGRLQRSFARVKPENSDMELLLEEASLKQRVDSLRMQWRSERSRFEYLRDRLSRLKEQGAPEAEINVVERELFLSEVDLEELEKLGKSCALELKAIALALKRSPAD